GPSLAAPADTAYATLGLVRSLALRGRARLGALGTDPFGDRARIGPRHRGVDGDERTTQLERAVRARGAVRPELLLVEADVARRATSGHAPSVEPIPQRFRLGEAVHLDRNDTPLRERCAELGDQAVGGTEVAQCPSEGRLARARRTVHDDQQHVGWLGHGGA